MAKVSLNALFKKMKGKIGGVYVRRHRDEFVLAQNPTRSELPKTKAAEENEHRFKKAVARAKHLFSVPEIKAFYAAFARPRKRNAWNVLVSDIRRKPRVHEINATEYTGSPGEVIIVEATDNVKVTGVSLVLTDGSGNVIEQGEAEMLPDSLWAYTVTNDVHAETTVCIAATATDFPGGTHTHTVEVVV